MINEYEYLERLGVQGESLPPVCRTYSPLVDEILSKHEWYDTEYFQLNKEKRKRLRYFLLDERFFIDTRPPIYSKHGCVQIPLNYNISLYHEKCKIDSSGNYHLNQSLKISKIKDNLIALNTLEHATSHGHFITQLIPQMWHCEKFFPDRNIFIPLNRQKWMNELLDYFGIRKSKLIFQSIPKHIHVQANDTLHLEVPDHTSGVLACKSFIENHKGKLDGVDGFDKVLLTRDFHYSRVKNIQEISENLKQTGFQLVNPLQLSMVDAEKILSKASVVVTEFGGAMTNLIHCNKETKIVILVPEALLDHRKNAKPKRFVYSVLEWLHPFLFDYNTSVVKGTYESQNGELYKWSSGDQLGDDERTKCTYPLVDILKELDI